VDFYDRFLSLSMFSRFIHVIAHMVLCSFLWLDNIPLHDIPWFVQQLMNIWAFPFFGYYGHLCTVFCEDMFSVLLGICVGVELLGYVVTWCLTFWRCHRSFEASVKDNLHGPQQISPIMIEKILDKVVIALTHCDLYQHHVFLATNDRGFIQTLHCQLILF